MGRIVVFGGTSEGRRLSELLTRAGKEVLVCVASTYGEEMLKDISGLRVRVGRLDAEGMKKLLSDENPEAVVDATHPYAMEASKNIREACSASETQYLRLSRPGSAADISKPVREQKKPAEKRRQCSSWEMQPADILEMLSSDEAPEASVTTVESIEEAAHFLSRHDGNALITTGSSGLLPFRTVLQYQERLTVRVLPSEESVSACRRAGFDGRHIIAMQGPFSAEMNELLLKETGSKWLVTKDSGDAGGLREKLLAAGRAGAGVILVRRPEGREGLSFEEIMRRLCPEGNAAKEAVQKNSPGEKAADSFGEMVPGLYPEKSVAAPRREVFLVGTGMGSPSLLTAEAEAAIQNADVLIGSSRLLEGFNSCRKPCFQSYRGEEIRTFLDHHTEYRKAAVLLSGDIGFYSGAKNIQSALEAAGTGEYRVEPVCGISSVQYFCAKCGISWEDVSLVSAHGRDENIAAAIRNNRLVFALAGGRQALEDLAKTLADLGFGGLTAKVGVNLSYPDERIYETTAAAMALEAPEGLVVIIFENPDAGKHVVTHGIPDERFIRGGVPMTKEEVRTVVLSKMRLTREAVVYDIGAGTGSVAVEAARQADRGRVYAIERKQPALQLIHENVRHFGVTNLKVVSGEAPEAMEGLPAPTHAFVGGSGGRLEEICEALLEKNPQVRIVVTAVSLEGISAIAGYLKRKNFAHREVTEISAARMREMGGYHMMTGMNPVVVAAFDDAEEAM